MTQRQLRTKADLLAALTRAEASLHELTGNHVELCSKYLDLKQDLATAEANCERWQRRICTLEESMAQIRRIAR